MNGFAQRNPAAVTVYYICALTPLMFCVNPPLSVIGLLSGGALFLLLGGRLKPSEYVFYAALPLISAIINPLFNHNGVTVLFFINNKPFTREALLYGLSIGLTLASVLLWCRSFSHIMTSDKLLYVTGRLSPKLALIISITLRYIPLYRRQALKTREAHMAIGLSRENNPPDKIKSGMRVFSGMVTWALENGVTTADSMTARGYGCGKRTRYTIYSWRSGDTALVIAALSFFAVIIAAEISGAAQYVWYPAVISPKHSVMCEAAYISFALLCILPVIYEAKEKLKWKSLLSKI